MSHEINGKRHASGVSGITGDFSEWLLLPKAEQKKLGVRVPKQVDLFYKEESECFEFRFTVKKVTKKWQ